MTNLNLTRYNIPLQLWQIDITTGYDVKDFREILKETLLHAGAKNIPAVFLISDNQIIDEDFLEDINSILISGEVTNLFDNDELEKIVGEG